MSILCRTFDLSIETSYLRYGCHVDDVAAPHLQHFALGSRREARAFDCDARTARVELDVELLGGLHQQLTT